MNYFVFNKEVDDEWLIEFVSVLEGIGYNREFRIRILRICVFFSSLIWGIYL